MEKARRQAGEEVGWHLATAVWYGLVLAVRRVLGQGWLLLVALLGTLEVAGRWQRWSRQHQR